MKLKCTTPVDVVGYHSKRNKAHDGKVAIVDIEIGITKDFAAKRIGEDFVTLAFSGMRVVEGEDGGEAIRHLQDSIKPGAAIVFENHRIELEGMSIDTQPKLLTVTPVVGAEKVIAKIRLRIDADNAQLRHLLSDKVGETLKAKFNPAQGSLPFANGNGHDESDDAGDEAQA